MKPLTPLLLAISIISIGCEPVRHYRRVEAVNMPGAVVGPRKPYGSVKLFQSKAEAPKHNVIALMSVQGGAGDEAAFINAFLHRAADVGADGLIFYRDDPGLYHKADNWNASTERAYRAEAIRFEK